jgi:hypothetical protein
MSSTLIRWKAFGSWGPAVLAFACRPFVLGLFLASHGICSGAERPDAQTIQSNCLKQRESVTQSGFLRLIIRAEHDIGTDAASELVSEMCVWFSGDQIRFDIRRRDERGEWSDEWERFAITGSTYTWIPEGEFEGVVASVSEYAQEPGGVMGHFRLFHPRWIGLGVNSESLMQYEAGARLVIPEARRIAVVATDELDGRTVWRLTTPLKYPPPEEGTGSIPGEKVCWFDPDAGWSLVRGEMREFAPQGTKVLSVRSRIRRFGTGDHWFPEEVIRETRYQERVTQRTTLSVLEADFSSGVDLSTFTASGMNLTAGKRIADRTQSDREVILVSDGRQLTPISGRHIQPAPPPVSSSRAWLLLLNAILLAGIGMVFLLRACRAKHT